MGLGCPYHRNMFLLETLTFVELGSTIALGSKWDCTGIDWVLGVNEGE